MTQKKKQNKIFSKLTIKSSRYKITIALAVIFFTIVYLVYYQGIQDENIEIKSTLHSEELLFIRMLDGIGVDENIKTNLRPVAVVIDNASDARPSIGVEMASLVYETIAEGSITRQLAIFDPENIPDVVGPVRSLRPYFLTWANEVDAIILHVGGSPQALDEVQDKDNINEFFGGQFFWRTDRRQAPHNILTSQSLIFQGIELFNYATTTKFTPWFYSSENNNLQTSSTVGVNFSIDEYRVEWIYDYEAGQYRRSVDGILELSYAKNIIIMVVPARILDSALRRELALIGEGRTWVVSNGRVILGTWKKEGDQSRTQFIDSDGNVIALSPGTTWVEVVDDEGRVTF